MRTPHTLIIGGDGDRDREREGERGKRSVDRLIHSQFTVAPVTKTRTSNDSNSTSTFKRLLERAFQDQTRQFSPSRSMLNIHALSIVLSRKVDCDVGERVGKLKITLKLAVAPSSLRSR